MSDHNIFQTLINVSMTSLPFWGACQMFGFHYVKLCQKNVDVGIFSATKPEKVTTDDASK
jgi:hypothetical protein